MFAKNDFVRVVVLSTTLSVSSVFQKIVVHLHIVTVLMPRFFRFGSSSKSSDAAIHAISDSEGPSMDKNSGSKKLSIDHDNIIEHDPSCSPKS
ncbi:hypothetical protein SNOG_03561 [Parastagonospora nodorum SN15]|uniref:Uncharacterized protein n=1 Tax=Phaeosphaeria nodorum (strain SN15 / ATCC MYA-4574 / FGSC 10173) TaxID=321614 RepID=Q0UXF3_PHANO|nr:hypothetical protein SNOG_03561 [Parastagonospora nodorum SN15]EAT88766.1 hypothetical protein SNOG_03561 [Parastagonospora nodorum SN15]